MLRCNGIVRERVCVSVRPAPANKEPLYTANPIVV